MKTAWRSIIFIAIAIASTPQLSQAAPTLPRHATFGAAVADTANGPSVTLVVPSGPAQVGGLRAGDILISIGGQPVSRASDYLRIVHGLAAGRETPVVVERMGISTTLLVTPTVVADESDPNVRTLYETVEVDGALRRVLLTVPANARGRRPAMLVIGGIGCYSIDVAANKEDPYLRLAHDLGNAGFVVMRLEKSGVGDSQGPPCHDVDFNAESASYETAFRALLGDPHVDPSRVYLFGHSIGTVIAPRIAAGYDVAGVIAAEAVGRNWIEYELRNSRRQLELGPKPDSPQVVDAKMIDKEDCIQRLLVEKQPEQEIEKIRPACKRSNGFYPVAASYVAELADLNIVEPWSKLHVPVLAIYGSSDFVTELADHERIVAIVNGTASGNASLQQIDAMDHLLGRAASQETAAENFAKGVKEEYDSELSERVIQWLCNRERCANAQKNPG